MKKPIAAIVAAAGMMVAFAETSTNTSPSKAVPEKKYPWKSSVSVGLTVARGNKNTTLFTGEFLTQRKTPADEYAIGVSGAYGSQSSKDTVNNYMLFGQWNRLFTDRFFGYARTDALRDRIKDIDYRLSIGPGLGYYLLKDTNTLLAAEAGGAVEFERLGHRDDSYATIRLAERFEHKLNDRARLWERLEFLPQVDKFDNYVVNFQIGMETSITKSFTMKTYLDDSYANRPAAGHQKNDARIVAAVSYKF